jgi:hypothetical protein
MIHNARKLGRSGVDVSTAGVVAMHLGMIYSESPDRLFLKTWNRETAFECLGDTFENLGVEELPDLDECRFELYAQWDSWVERAREDARVEDEREAERLEDYRIQQQECRNHVCSCCPTSWLGIR